MAFLNSKHGVARLILLAAIALSVQSQRNLTNPLLSFRYPNQTANLYLPLQVLQYDIMRLDNTHQPFMRVVPTTVNASNPFTEALNQVNTFFQFVINTTEVSYYNARYLFGKVSVYHLTLFQNFTNNYFTAINTLNSVIDTMNSDENGVMNDLVLLQDNIGTYITNFNQSVVNCNATLNMSTNVSGFLAANSGKLTTNLQNLMNSYQDLYRRARIASSPVNGTALANMTASLNRTIGGLQQNISSVQGYYNQFVNNFTSRGGQLMGQFWLQFNASCGQNERSLNDSQGRLDEFRGYVDNAKATYWNWTNRLVSQAKDAFKRQFTQDMNNFTQVSTEAAQIIASQIDEIEAWNTKNTQQNSALADLLTKISAFSVAESSTVSSLNTQMLALAPLSSSVEFQNAVNGVIANMSLVVNGPSTTNVVPISINQTNFTVVYQSSALNYDISWTQQLPPTPPNPTANLPYFDSTTLASYNIAPFSQIPNDIPIGQPICSGAPAANVAFPALFTAYPCFDPSQAQVNLYPQTPSVSQKWLSFMIDVSNYNLQYPAAVLISLSAQNPPNSVFQFSQPLTFASSIPAPNQVGSATPAQAPSGTQTNHHNGWNNFVFSYRVVSRLTSIEVLVNVDDIEVAKQINLMASVSFLAA